MSGGVELEVTPTLFFQFSRRLGEPSESRLTKLDRQWIHQDDSREEAAGRKTSSPPSKKTIFYLMARNGRRVTVWKWKSGGWEVHK